MPEGKEEFPGLLVRFMLDKGQIHVEHLTWVV